MENLAETDQLINAGIDRLRDGRGAGVDGAGYVRQRGLNVAGVVGRQPVQQKNASRHDAESDEHGG
jgi:hypothetical protein